MEGLLPALRPLGLNASVLLESFVSLCSCVLAVDVTLPKQEILLLVEELGRQSGLGVGITIVL